MRPPRPDWAKKKKKLRNVALKEYILNSALDTSQRKGAWRINRSDGNVKLYLRKANCAYGKTDGTDP
jgi:hypothetical protein